MTVVDNQSKKEQQGLKNQGHLHPTRLVINEINRIFAKMGFEVAESPEIETEYNNFDVLRVAKDHPSRDMQDTFWLKDVSPEGERLLPRTHTSGVQVRFMKSHKPPFRMISPGKVFRNEATDATHEAEFYQFEGMYIDKVVTLAHLKGVLNEFFKEFFGPSAEIRFRPSFFPFTEPSVEVDVKRGDKWLEVLGGGLTHPDVIRAGGIDPDEWKGFTFGGGIERLVLLKYGISDIRDLFSGDQRVINQF